MGSVSGLRVFYQRYMLPGIVFQSVLVGGGYGTGREIVEFFTVHGGLGGLLGMGVTAVMWGLVLAVAFEFSRITKSYDYRAFFSKLLGPFWHVYEGIYLLIAVLVLSVVGAAAGEMALTAMGIPSLVGVAVLLIAIGLIVYLGGRAIELVFTQWSLMLFVVYGLFLAFVMISAGEKITEVLADAEVVGSWHLDGLRYAAYNLVALAAVLFVLPHVETRRQAVASGVFAGLAGIAPGVLVFIALLSQYPEVQTASVPVVEIIIGLNMPWFSVLFQLVLFGTFVETGAGIIHSINERIAAKLKEKNKSYTKKARVFTAVVILVVAMFLAKEVGVVDLIAKGYGLLSYGYILFVIIPILTIGVFQISKLSKTERVGIYGQKET